ncbi:class II aldolase/adducin N-terminal domain protein [Bacteriovorax sp. BSW11_IV]|uniref:class II aldolase/adducin family protein n=1 Tax=Bacteriovorax sp. BSW11_IV TaxID=1353529 RepID=UPI00038A5114|nr:class II aldolase/adducin family protein [Bacteriovorax sp. BSW11_IV]EQC49562.1 class II aldolase/adducin N-terminal domain protein [Bacteriovorax sp. BSW11_IV]
MVIDDGVIKYDLSGYIHSGNLQSNEYSALEKYREILFALNLIGEYPEEQVGFGNMSVKIDYSSFHQTSNPQFVITGTQTGKYAHLTGEHYTRVLDYDIKAMTLKAMGPVKASSEAITHGAIYLSNHKINTVFHIHNENIWNGMIEKNFPATPANIPYGTYEMAMAVKECMGETSEGYFVMKGHKDGVVIYAQTLERCHELSIELNNLFNP